MSLCLITYNMGLSLSATFHTSTAEKNFTQMNEIYHEVYLWVNAAPLLVNIMLAAWGENAKNRTQNFVREEFHLCQPFVTFTDPPSLFQAKMECLVRILLWSSVLTWTRVSSQSGRGKEVFFVNLEEGFFGCQVNETAEVLQIFKINKLCDGVSDCFRGSDENSKELKCSSKWKHFPSHSKSKLAKTSDFPAKPWESGFWCVLPLCAMFSKEIEDFWHKLLPFRRKLQFSEIL